MPRFRRRRSHPAVSCRVPRETHASRGTATKIRHTAARFCGRALAREDTDVRSSYLPFWLWQDPRHRRPCARYGAADKGVPRRGAPPPLGRAGRGLPRLRPLAARRGGRARLPRRVRGQRRVQGRPVLLLLGLDRAGLRCARVRSVRARQLLRRCVPLRRRLDGSALLRAALRYRVLRPRRLHERHVRLRRVVRRRGVRARPVPVQVLGARQVHRGGLRVRHRLHRCRLRRARLPQRLFGQRRVLRRPVRLPPALRGRGLLDAAARSGGRGGARAGGPRAGGGCLRRRRHPTSRGWRRVRRLAPAHAAALRRQRAVRGGRLRLLLGVGRSHLRRAPLPRRLLGPRPLRRRRVPMPRRLPRRRVRDRAGLPRRPTPRAEAERARRSALPPLSRRAPALLGARPVPRRPVRMLCRLRRRGVRAARVPARLPRPRRVPSRRRVRVRGRVGGAWLRAAELRPPSGVLGARLLLGGRVRVQRRLDGCRLHRARVPARLQRARHLRRRHGPLRLRRRLGRRRVLRRARLPARLLGARARLLAPSRGPLPARVLRPRRVHARGLRVRRGLARRRLRAP